MAVSQLSIIVLVALPLATLPARAAFDRPLDKVVIHADHGLGGAKADVTITCSYYPTFMVKEISGDPEPNLEYAGAVVPGIKPDCREINKTETYSGWGPFVGVRSGFVFFDSGGPYEHNGRGFVVTNGSGHMLFSDFRIGDYQSLNSTNGGIVLRYRRMFTYHCSLYFGGATECWGEIKTATGLTDASTPECREAYDDLYRTFKLKWPRFANDVKREGATISYNVEAKFTAAHVTYTPLPGAVDCWPAG